MEIDYLVYIISFHPTSTCSSSIQYMWPVCVVLVHVSSCMWMKHFIQAVPAIVCTIKTHMSVSLQSPSVYSGYRRRALDHTLKKISSTLSSNQEPLYIYGDFNFRLDFSAVLKVTHHRSVVVCYSRFCLSHNLISTSSTLSIMHTCIHFSIKQPTDCIP